MQGLNITSFGIIVVLLDVAALNIFVFHAFECIVIPISTLTHLGIA